MGEDTAVAAKRFTVSVPADLVQPLEAAAAREDRSVSGQIVNIIRQWLARQRRSVVVSDEEFASLIRETREAAARNDGSVPATLEQLIDRSFRG
jgi:metal-responsive CopG/Arc/MetJ family transcriptional regulator